MPIKAVIFDMDGVLIDARDWHYLALNQALAIFGESIEREEHLSRFDGLPTKVKLRMLEGEGRLPPHLHGIVEAIKQERTLRIAAMSCLPNVEHLILLGLLKARGVSVGVATNSVSVTSQFMLESAGLLEFVDVLATNEDVSRPKPAPDVYLEVLRQLDVRAEEALAVEDSETGVSAAKSAGLRVIQVESPSDVNLGLLSSEFSTLY